MQRLRVTAHDMSIDCDDAMIMHGDI